MSGNRVIAVGSAHTALEQFYQSLDELDAVLEVHQKSWRAYEAGKSVSIASNLTDWKRGFGDFYTSMRNHCVKMPVYVPEEALMCEALDFRTRTVIWGHVVDLFSIKDALLRDEKKHASAMLTPAFDSFSEVMAKHHFGVNFERCMIGDAVNFILTDGRDVENFRQVLAIAHEKKFEAKPQDVMNAEQFRYVGQVLRHYDAFWRFRMVARNKGADLSRETNMLHQ